MASLLAQMVKNLLQCRRPRFDPWVGKNPWRKQWQPTPVFLCEEFYGQRSLVGCNPSVVKCWAGLSDKHWSHFSKIMLKILQARLQQYTDQELPDVQAGFRKGRETKDQFADIHWIIEKAREFQKTSTSASLTMLKPLTVRITINCGKFFKRWEHQTTCPASWEICM